MSDISATIRIFDSNGNSDRWCNWERAATFARFPNSGEAVSICGKPAAIIERIAHETMPAAYPIVAVECTILPNVTEADLLSAGFRNLTREGAP